MSERGFSATIEAELDAALAHLALLVELVLDGGTERLWSGIGDITYGGNTYTGAGELGSIDKVGDSLDKADAGVELVLDYLDDTIRNELVTSDSVGNNAAIHLAVMNPATRAVIDGYEIFAGFIDQIEILDEGETGQLRVRVASELARLRRPQYAPLTNAYQQFLFPGDLGMEFSATMDEPVLWGRKPLQPRAYTPPSPAQNPYFNTDYY